MILDEFIKLHQPHLQINTYLSYFGWVKKAIIKVEWNLTPRFLNVLFWVTLVGVTSLNCCVSQVWSMTSISVLSESRAGHAVVSARLNENKSYVFGKHFRKPALLVTC